LSAPTAPSPADFLLGVKSIAIVGVSQRRNFGSLAFRELKQRGYTVYPVHPSLEVFEGERCYRSCGEFVDPPDCLFVAVAPEKALGLARQAASAGVRRIWYQQGADFTAAAAEAKEAGLEVITGRCVLMYAEPVTGFHRFHKLIARLFGKF